MDHRYNHIYHRIKLIQDKSLRLTNPNSSDNSGAVQYVDIYPYLKNLVFSKNLPSKEDIYLFNKKYEGTASIAIIDDDNISLTINRPWCDDIKRLFISSGDIYEDYRFADYEEFLHSLKDDLIGNGTTLGAPAICYRFRDEITLMNRTLDIMRNILKNESSESPLQYLNQVVFEICLYRDRLQYAIFEEQNPTKSIYESYKLMQAISYYKLYVNGQDLSKNKELKEFIDKLVKENV